MRCLGKNIKHVDSKSYFCENKSEIIHYIENIALIYNFITYNYFAPLDINKTDVLHVIEHILLEISLHSMLQIPLKLQYMDK